MRWPWTGDEDEDKKPQKSWIEEFDTVGWSVFTEPRTLVPSLLFTATTIAAVRVYKSYLRRIPSVNHIKPSYFRRRSLFGKVTSVGDADNFRLYHTPGGRLAGWGWLPWKKVPSTREGLANQTIHIRIAGVDAPELAHWGREAQPYSQEAFDFLTQYLLNKRVRAYIYRRDQYDRVVASVHIRKQLFKKDVGLEMLKRGLATIYEAKSGAEFGKSEQVYRSAEEKAKQDKVGMWSKPSLIARLVRGDTAKKIETPREYKTRHTTAEKNKKS
ncbi:SNase-domain-containing protein [Delitschia confertaspora ATCC 74209]|uniref:Probable endonuclease LCL3 n=1 Tax=Delitschia confertaspora ATCC 74209 TaxID=1513339 RepID=A0A9P4MU82_9PLEO|nr:SNase-domain-containing protein [Delitschia confertaspora ATCC 74209]